MLSTSYKMLSIILFVSLTAYVDEIIMYHQCGFKCVDHRQIDNISCIHEFLEKKLKCSETVHQLFIDFKKAYGSFRRILVYNILIEFGTLN
jgi:hypothetical protein